MGTLENKYEKEEYKDLNEKILLHVIEYTYWDDFKGEPNMLDKEHIRKCICQDINCGELRTMTTPDDIIYSGWWRIKIKS